MLSYLIYFFIIQDIKTNNDTEEPIGYIKIKLDHFFSNFYDIPIYINSNKKKLAIPDLNSSYTLIYDDLKKSEIDISSFTTNSEEIIYRNKLINISTFQKEFTIEASKNITISLTYYYTLDYLSTIHSILGFGYSFDNDSYSIIHQLLYKGLITSASFAFSPKYETPFLFLGGIPSIYTANRNYSYINIIGNSNKWDFYIDAFSIKNETKESKYKIKRYAYFVSLESFIFAPSDLFEQLVSFYLSDFSLKGHCHILDKISNRYILCSIHPKIRMGNLTFLINGYEYSFTAENFWSCGEEYCIFSIKENIEENQWVIGSDFVGMFSMLFDYENKRVNIYSKRIQVIKVSNESSNTLSYNDNIGTLKCIIIIEMIISLIGLITLIFIQRIINIKSSKHY